VKKWIKQNDVTFEAAAYIGNHDDIAAKLSASDNSEGFDLTTVYQGYKPLYYDELGIVQALDINKIPNLEGVNDFWSVDQKQLWTNEEGAWTGIPWTFGAIGLTYNTAEIDRPSAWTDLLDPSLKGKISCPDDPVGHLTTVCAVLGLDPGALPKAELANVIDFSSQIVAQCEAISPTFSDMSTKLVDGSIVACFQGWAYMHTETAAAGLTSVDTIIPEEGSWTFADMYAMPTGADNVDAAHAFMNNLLDPEVNAAAAEYLVAGATVDASVPLLSKDAKALYDVYDDPSAFFDSAPLYANPPTESDEFVTFSEWQEAWQEIKAGVA
jgi:spermidine/putrescine transport system substrate-binding protein